jgi:hypothetical protein
MNEMKKILICVVFVLAFFGIAAAQSPPAKDKDGYEPVSADMMEKGESIPASRLVAGAYGFIFAAVVVWVSSVTARSRRVEEEMDELRRKLEGKGK